MGILDSFDLIRIARGLLNRRPLFEFDLFSGPRPEIL